MKRHNLPIGKIMGIQLGLDYSWFLIFGLMTWLLATNYYPAEFKNWSQAMYWLMGAATAVMLFVSVVLHELGHSEVAIRFKVPVHSITLFLFGGVSEIDAEPPSAKAEFFIAFAGPMVSIILGVVFLLLMPVVVGIQPLWALMKYLAYINIVLAVFNLIPGYPLDGGRVFRAIVWSITKNLRKATLIAANTGRVFGFILIFFGVVQMFAGNVGNGIWIAFIGWFLDHAASAEAHQVMFQTMLTGHTVAQAMNRQCPTVPEALSVQALVDEHILGTGNRCFLVQRGLSAVGMMTLDRVREVPRTEWNTKIVGDVMFPLEQLKTTTPESGLWPVLKEMELAGASQIPVMNGTQVVGVLSREDIVSFLGTVKELGG